MHDWPKCEETIHVELVSLAKCYVFRPIVKKLIGIKLVGYKCIFVRKLNKKNEVIRYKYNLLHKVSQRYLVLIINETYSSVMYAVTF